MALTNTEKQKRWREKRNALARGNPEAIEHAASRRHQPIDQRPAFLGASAPSSGEIGPRPSLHNFARLAAERLRRAQATGDGRHGQEEE
jgi:hypothetical protein